MVELARRAAAVLLLALAAAAQERGTTAQPGGRLLLMNEGFALGEREAQACFGASAGPRLVLSIAGETPLDPLGEASPAGRPGSVRRMALAPAAARTLDWTPLEQALGEAALIELLDGRWVDWWQLGSIDSRATPLALGLREAHRRGTPIVATGAAARYAAASSVVPYAEIGRKSANPRRVDLYAAFEGLGLTDLALESTSAAGDSLERLLRVFLRSPLSQAALLHGRSALLLDERADTARVLAPAGAVWWVDVHDARRQRELLRGGTISRARDGSTWSAGSNGRPGGVRQIAAEGTAEVELVRVLAHPRAAGSAGARAPESGPSATPFARERWQDWTSSAAWTDPRPLVLRSAGAQLTLYLDGDTAWERGTDGAPQGAPLLGLRFDAAWEFPDPGR